MCEKDTNCQFRAGACEALPSACWERLQRTCSAGGSCRWNAQTEKCGPLSAKAGKVALLQLVLLLPHDAQQELDSPGMRSSFKAAVAFALTEGAGKVVAAYVNIISIEQFYPDVDHTRMKQEGTHIWEQTAVALEVTATEKARGERLLRFAQQKDFPARLLEGCRKAHFTVNPTGHRVHEDWITVGEATLQLSETGFVPGQFGQSVVRAATSDAGTRSMLVTLSLAIAAVFAVGMCMAKTNCASICFGSADSNRRQRKGYERSLEMSARPAPYRDSGGLGNLGDADESGSAHSRPAPYRD